MHIYILTAYTLLTRGFALLLFRWFGKCWYIHNLLKYEFDVEFDVSRFLSRCT